MLNILFDSNLLIIAAITALATEAAKRLFGDKKVSYNVIAIILSAIVSIGFTVSDTLLSSGVFDTNRIVYIVNITFLSAIIAMVGYDKFKQAIGQIKK